MRQLRRVTKDWPVPKTPEQWLEQAAPEKKAGILKLFLGYAPGVGKTYNMLSEAIRRSKRGEDVVIGVVETHGRKGVAELLSQLQAVPRKKLEYKGTVFEEMDVDAILARCPQVVLIDELALRHVTHSVDRSLEEYLQRKHIDQNWGVAERVAVCISSNPASQQLIARGARMADGLDAEFYVVHVETGKGCSEERATSLAANIRFAENLGAKVFQIEASNVASAV